MNADFDKLFQAQLQNAGTGKRLLLHCCCAPCATACLTRVCDSFEVTALFYNPNIQKDEFEKRKAELERLLSITGQAKLYPLEYCDEQKFYEAARGLESLSEGGARCAECFTLRLKKTAELADEGGYDYFATTLTLSPLKNAALINAIGERVAGKAQWLYSDFKKRDGYLNSIKLSRQYGLYRQNYCGCEFSRRQAEQRNNGKIQ